MVSPLKDGKMTKIELINVCVRELDKDSEYGTLEYLLRLSHKWRGEWYSRVLGVSGTIPVKITGISNEGITRLLWAMFYIDLTHYLQEQHISRSIITERLKDEVMEKLKTLVPPINRFIK